MNVIVLAPLSVYDFLMYCIFSIVSGDLSRFFSSSRAAYVFYFVTLSKCINDAQSFLGCLVFEQTLISHNILFSIMCRLRHRRDYVEEKAVLNVKHHYMGYQLLWSLCAQTMYLKRQASNCTKLMTSAKRKDKLSQASSLITKRDFPSTSTTRIIKTWAQETARSFEKAS